MTLTIEQIKKKLSAIKKLGYVKTLRNGPTGIGYTLETLLEIRELLRIPMTRNIKNFKTNYKDLKLKCLNIVKQITNTKILLLQSYP